MDQFFFFQEDVGQHEKIFLKLLEESPTFKQLYYSRYADMMNTVYTCENMIEKLDSMLVVIEPEMPAQIARWGGSMTEWESNVDDLKDFINQRCEAVNTTMTDCYSELSGPYNVTLMTQPDGIGEIDFNTLDIEEFPWQGNYYGGMENNIKAKVFNDFEDTYAFSHWESTAGNLIADENEFRTTYSISQQDTLIAVFSTISEVENLDTKFSFKVFPNPASDYLTLDYELTEAMDVQVSLQSILGQKVLDFNKASGRRAAGNHKVSLNLDSRNISSGLYFLVLDVGEGQRSIKVNVIR
jgi:hypothetical protein